MEANMHSTIDETRHGTPIQVRLREELLSALEDWRRSQQSIPSRPEAIRRLLQQSLAPETFAQS
jgi:hypothetical protein